MVKIWGQPDVGRMLKIFAMMRMYCMALYKFRGDGVHAQGYAVVRHALCFGNVFVARGAMRGRCGDMPGKRFAAIPWRCTTKGDAFRI